MIRDCFFIFILFQNMERFSTYSRIPLAELLLNAIPCSYVHMIDSTVEYNSAAVTTVLPPFACQPLSQALQLCLPLVDCPCFSLTQPLFTIPFLKKKTYKSESDAEVSAEYSQHIISRQFTRKAVQSTLLFFIFQKYRTLQTLLIHGRVLEKSCGDLKLLFMTAEPQSSMCSCGFGLLCQHFQVMYVFKTYL